MRILEHSLVHSLPKKGERTTVVATARRARPLMYPCADYCIAEHVCGCTQCAKGAFPGSQDGRSHVINDVSIRIDRNREISALAAFSCK